MLKRFYPGSGGGACFLSLFSSEGLWEMYDNQITILQTKLSLYTMPLKKFHFTLQVLRKNLAT